MFVLLFILWVIFLANFTIEIMIFGIAISAVMVFCSYKFLNYGLKKEKKLWTRIGKYFVYLLILIVEIIKANAAVAKIIITGKKIEPAVFDFETDLNSTGKQVLLANSITLTPGTITAKMENGKYVIHCIDKSMAVGIADSVFVRRLRALDPKKTREEKDA